MKHNSGIREQYLEGEGVNDLAQLMRLGIKGGGTVEEATTAKHHPARLQLFISTVHKTPAQTQHLFHCSVILLSTDSSILLTILSVNYDKLLTGCQYRHI